MCSDTKENSPTQLASSFLLSPNKKGVLQPTLRHMLASFSARGEHFLLFSARLSEGDVFLLRFRLQTAAQRQEKKQAKALPKQVCLQNLAL